MKIRFGTKFIYSCVFLLVLLSCAIGQFENQTLYEAQVTLVTDGDTIVVQFTGSKPPPECSRIERVRFIGVNTPELTKKPIEVFAREARDYTNRLYRKRIFLEFDTVTSLRDRYGRLLAYVYTDNSSLPVNMQLILGGYGFYYGKYAFDPERMSEFKQAETYAKQQRAGLWGL